MPSKEKNPETATIGSDPNSKLRNETKLLRDTLDLLWNKTLEQQQLCEQSEKENEYLQEYINSLMASSNVLDRQ
ncbi:hypothetical protein TPHA_0A01850 [Tetrapisispora phaffii CBS 4417]|uniref:Uncharacterized protein n=1 Tax=Tetrapisispora phaffii (strain ATCC 24235 / CBS 4417 / NBRC 1672 / NRRL Y-8282 / UCD 70-5) TaxID=1071381 RepID=G8BMZ0_TETPH|nr:hypothetical protein TPHA_0A01850 [Tetrapisispora phaffii CBS 4417]CCE61268.1 hypothetical protein TPHA_0A01850 [Tetrapisispora phaffii CBS 4417]